MLFDPLLKERNSPRFERETCWNKMPPLAPISEVRTVTFAARYVQNDADELSYTPVDIVWVKFIPHHSEYDCTERNHTWYTNEEVNAMKQQALLDAKNCRRDEFKQRRQLPLRNSKTDIRGLERLIYNDYHQACARMRYDGLQALLKEQSHQRFQKFGIYNPGGINNGGDDERIRMMVMKYGGSLWCQTFAQRQAQQDSAEVDEYLGRSIELGDDQDDDNDTITSISTNQEQSPPSQTLTPRIGRKLHSSATASTTPPCLESTNECCWCVDVVEKVGRSLLLHAILAPFLQLQQGNALLD